MTSHARNHDHSDDHSRDHSRDHSAAAVGVALAELGVRTVFGIAARDNAPLADVLERHQVRLVAAPRADSIAAMAVAHARAGGHLTALLVTSDTPLTTALSGIAAAVTSRTPLLVLAPLPRAHPTPLAPAETALLGKAGALVQDLPDLRQVPAVVADAARAAQDHQRPVLLRIPTSQDATRQDVASQHTAAPPPARADEPRLDLLAMPAAEPAAVEELAALLGRARRPVFLVGRGAARAAAPIEDLAQQAGALLATSLAAHGLFQDNPWHIGIAGMLATPDMAELLAAADAVVSWGCSLDGWTTGHGSLLAADADLAQIDINPAALGLHRSIDLGVAGDAGRTAHALQQVMGGRRTGYRTEPVRERIAAQASWHDVGYQPMLETGDRVDPRTFSLVLDTILPAGRTLIVEPSTILGYPISYLRVPDADGFCFAPPGLGLASGIGAALARPDRLTVIALDTGTASSAAADLETAARLRLPLLVIAYDDQDPVDARPASTPAGTPAAAPAVEPAQSSLAVKLARFAAIGHGCRSAVIRRPADLTVVSDWAAGPDPQPLLLHAQVTRNAWWLGEHTYASTPGHVR